MVRAVEVIRSQAQRGRDEASSRWTAAVGPRSSAAIDDVADSFVRAGRLTLNFHPDRVASSGRTVVDGLLADGRYRSQWATGISNGSRSAIAGGDRERFERDLFDGAYDAVEPGVEHPVYGAFDLLHDMHGGSPRFGSCFVVLRPHVLERTTMCVGDSHLGPRDVGLTEAPWALLAGLAEQAAAGALLDRPIDVDGLLRVLDGTASRGIAARRLDGYIEAQVHGGVDLADDVESIVVDPSFRGTAVEADLSSIQDRYGTPIRWHGGSELHADDMPSDARGPDMPRLARSAARSDGVVDAAAIGRRVLTVARSEPLADGDPPESELQQWKYLWHVLFAHGHDAATPA